MDEREERVVADVDDGDAIDFGLQVVDDVAEQVVGHRPRRVDVLDLQRDRVRFEHADPDGQHARVLIVAKDDDRHVGHGIDREPFDGHLDQHGRS